MQTEAIFEDIGNRIQKEIRKAQKSIFVAVAWFTNRNLFNELIIKAKHGCDVYLIISDDEINKNSLIDFEQLQTGNSKVFKVGAVEKELMHNKFCVIDYNTVITGVCAPAAVASAAEANNIATLFSFFMVLLLGKKPQPRCESGRWG